MIDNLNELSEYQIDRERGFLPSEDPLLSLPKEFSAWEQVAADLPRLLPSPHLRPLIEDLPEFPIHHLDDERQWRRSLLILSCLGHAYVWQGETPATRIPKRLAVPWHQAASHLGRHPVLSYASYALENWSRIHPDKPIELENLVKRNNFLGGLDESWFVMVHVHIEAHSAPGVIGSYQATAASMLGDDDGITLGLQAMASALEEMNHGLARMSENCDAYIYYHRVRPFIHGWKNHPALPDGVHYEGVAEYSEKPQRFRGETGAQSSLVPTFDAALQISHSQDSLKPYLIEMRDYMPPAHRKFIEDIEQRSKVRTRVVESESAVLRDLYNHCIEELAAFRDTHLNFAIAFIHNQEQGSSSNPVSVGTAGTPFIKYLRKHSEETLTYRI